MSETVEATRHHPSRPEVAAKLERIDTCDIPPYLPVPTRRGPLIIADVAYGEDGHQSYDLALPEGLPKLLVVLIHGGGWTAGTKSLFRPTIRSLAMIGYAAATVEYRLARDESRLPRAWPRGRAVRDTRGASRRGGRQARPRGRVRGGAPRGDDRDRRAFTRCVDCADRSPIHVSGAVLFYPPLELDRARERYIPIMRQAVDEALYGAKAFKDGVIDEGSPDWMVRARRETPRHFITGRAPPMLLFHGDADNIIPEEDARDFTSALQAAGVPSLLVELPGQGHGFPVLGRTPPVRTASCTMLQFLAQISAQ